MTQGASRSPFVARANPSAMFTATRSLRAMIGRIPSSEAELSSRFSGNADDELGSRALEEPHRLDRRRSHWYTVTRHPNSLLWQAPAMQVEIWSDVVCAWCYIGKRRFEEALAAFAARDEVEVTWRSFELDPEGSREPIR